MTTAETAGDAGIVLNADDLGRSQVATDAILRCFDAGRVSSTSAMVFMADSERAAELAARSNIDVGLHLNLTESFTGSGVPVTLRKQHERIRSFLRTSKYAQLLYNPFCRSAIAQVLDGQIQEFERLYGYRPDHLDGHQHAHLCTNVLVDKLLPAGTRIRRSFSFEPGERGWFNRTYRRIVDRSLARRHALTDYFFALSKNLASDRLRHIFDLARRSKVELMLHPEVRVEYDRVMSGEFGELLQTVTLANYRSV